MDENHFLLNFYASQARAAGRCGYVAPRVDARVKPHAVQG